MRNKKAKAIRKLIKEQTGFMYNANEYIRNLYRKAKREALRV